MSIESRVSHVIIQVFRLTFFTKHTTLTLGLIRRGSDESCFRYMGRTAYGSSHQRRDNCVSELDDETRVYIQRGNHGHNVECYEYVLSHVLGPKADLSQYAVTFDDPSVNGIGVGSVDSGEYYSCENGELRSWDGGESILMKRF